MHGLATGAATPPSDVSPAGPRVTRSNRPRALIAHEAKGTGER